jgi:predicted permease
MLVIGFLVRKFKLLNEEELPHVNNVIFYVLYPLLLYSSLSKVDISQAIDAKLILFTLAATVAVYSGSLIFSLLVEKNNDSRGAMTQAIFQSNFVIMGLPLVANIYGNQNIAVTSVMLAIIVPVNNVLAVVTLETFRGSKIHFGRILMGIIKNPLILGAFAGILAMIFHIRLPEILDKTITSISVAAAPMALIILGASFHFSSVVRCRRNLIFTILGRLVVVPGIGLTIAALAGFRDIAFVTLIGLFATSSATSSFTMAQQMDSDSELAANSVVFTAALSCLTMFFWVFLFKQLGMF